MVRRRTGDVVARLEFGRRQPKSERQLFVEAQGSSKGQAFSAIACTLQFEPEVMASSHHGTCLAESRCIAILCFHFPSI